MSICKSRLKLFFRWLFGALALGAMPVFLLFQAIAGAGHDLKTAFLAARTDRTLGLALVEPDKFPREAAIQAFHVRNLGS